MKEEEGMRVESDLSFLKNRERKCIVVTFFQLDNTQWEIKGKLFLQNLEKQSKEVEYGAENFYEVDNIFKPKPFSQFLAGSQSMLAVHCERLIYERS